MGRPVHHNLFSIYYPDVVGLFRSHGLLSKHLQSFFNTTVYVLMFFKKYFRLCILPKIDYDMKCQKHRVVFGLETSFPHSSGHVYAALYFPGRSDCVFVKYV